MTKPSSTRPFPAVVWLILVLVVATACGREEAAAGAVEAADADRGTRVATVTRHLPARRRGERRSLHDRSRDPQQP